MRSSTADPKDKIDFCNKLEKLSDSLKEKSNNRKECQKRLMPDDFLLDKEILCTYDQEKKQEDHIPLNVPLNLLNENLSINLNHNLISLTAQNVTVVESLQEITSFIDKHYLLTQSNNINIQKVWDFCYTDNKGINIDFRLHKTSNEQFNLSCNINTNNLKKYIHELNARLNKKGWSLISDSSDINFIIIRTLQN
jgi:hypothetical protein